ncbi:hypothetical protein PFISCL1PPCAC_22318 [Pristionchus fissidentatus]|uniref:C2H2-type domain-containing protein n=1 Tax=Pristionchus fissidentatus TaxID=1538716 RepID=A0AAV5WFJ1_9BILA|nr:hypothetical protein PFISCL1PPCAC_22318 [Pristionchus fissidentatus]
MSSHGSMGDSSSGETEQKPGRLQLHHMQQVQHMQQQQFGTAQPQLQYYAGGFGQPGAGLSAGANPMYGAGWAPPHQFPVFGGPGMAPYFGGFYGNGPSGQINGPLPTTVSPTGSAPVAGYRGPEKDEHDRYRQELDALKASIEKKMKESMMKNFEEKAKVNLRESESQKKIEKLEKWIDKLEKELEATRAANAMKERSDNPLSTQPTPEKKEDTTQTVDSDNDKQNEVKIIVLNDSEDDEPVDEEAGEVQSERISLGRSCKSAAKISAAAAAAAMIAGDAASNNSAIIAAKRSKRDTEKEEKTEGMKCFKCSHVMNTVSTYIKHLKNTHKVTLSEVGASFNCLVCGATTRSNAHDRCKQCPNARFIMVCDDFDRAAKMCKEKKEEDKTEWMQCIKCPHLAKTISGYIQHLKVRHNTTPEEVGISFKCVACGHTSRSRHHEDTQCPNARFTVINDEDVEKEDKTDWIECVKCSAGLSFKCLVCAHTSRSHEHMYSKQCPNPRFMVFRDDERDEE